MKKLLSFIVLFTFSLILLSCEQGELLCEDCLTSQSSQAILASTTRSGNPCSYPFSATWTYSSDGFSSTTYYLSASQTTDKKWRCRSSTSVGNGTNFRKFRMTVTNNHSSYPIVFRAVGVVTGLFSDESYTLLDGCYTINAGQSKVIRFDNVSPLYGPGTGGRLYDKVYDKVDWEIIVQNGNQIGQTATTVPVTVELASWFNTEP